MKKWKDKLMNRSILMILLLVILACAGCSKKQEDKPDEKQNEISSEYTIAEPISIVHNQTYKSYDLTGDGKQDQLQFVCLEVTEEFGDEVYGTKWAVLVNGKTMLTFDSEGMFCLEGTLYQVDAERNYIFLKQCLNTNDDIEGAALYRFEDGYLRKELDLYDWVTRNINVFHCYIDVTNVTGRYLTVQCANQFNATAYLRWEMNYEYNAADDSWEAFDEVYLLRYDNGLEYKAIGMTANQKFEVYEDWTCEDRAFWVKKGDVVKLKQIRFYEGETYFNVEDEEGRTGWFPDPKEIGIQQGDTYIYGLFEEAQFAG